VPVITSDNSSLPEVVGDAAILIDAKNTNQIKESNTKVLTDKKLSKEMIKKGLTQSKKFSWKKSAKKLLSIINSFNH